MARPKGSKNKPKIGADGAEMPKAEGSTLRNPGHGDNSGDLTDEQRQKLHLQHKGHYEKALAAKKAADASFKNICKVATAELGELAIDDIKTSIKLETPEGVAKFKAEIESQMRVARWNSLPVGFAGDLFGEDREPVEDKAFAAGKAAGMAGEHPNAPHHFGGVLAAKWMEGWHAGQAVNVNKIKQLDPAEGDGLPDAPSTAADPTSAADDDMRPAFLRSVK